MKLREGDPWIPADEYGRSLRGLSVNLLVRDIPRAHRLRPGSARGRAGLLRSRFRDAPPRPFGVDAPRRPHLSRPSAPRQPRGRRSAGDRSGDPATRHGPGRGRSGGPGSGATRSLPRRWTSRTACGKSSSSIRTAISGRSNRPPRRRRLLTALALARRPSPPDSPDRSRRGRPAPPPTLATRRASVVHYATGGR